MWYFSLLHSFFICTIARNLLIHVSIFQLHTKFNCSRTMKIDFNSKNIHTHTHLYNTQTHKYIERMNYMFVTNNNMWIINYCNLLTIVWEYESKVKARRMGCKMCERFVAFIIERLYIKLFVYLMQNIANNTY